MTDQEMRRNGCNMGSFLSGLLVGGLMGAAAAVLMAPQSGEETRTLILDKGTQARDKGIELKDSAVATADQTRAQAEELARTVQERTEEIARQGRERIEEGKDRFKSTVETIK
jgi:gas vesicle protein